MGLRSERRFINIRNIKPGMMIQFSYTKLSGENAQYVVLVIDPDRKGTFATESQLHGYLIKDTMTDEEILKFFSSIKKNISLDYEDRRKSLVSDLDSDEAYKQFLSSPYAKDRMYRTFNISKMSAVRQILLGGVE